MEPDISPLAKRLAEENNVNWRSLGGSGSEGRIVERDVLEYLAKVMAGDEDVNPTPEPTPEGMDAWPEEDTAGYFKSVPNAQTADVATGVSADDPFSEPSVAVTSSAADPFAAEPLETETSSQDDVDISEDIFLFDDDVSEVEENEAFAATFDSSSDQAGVEQAAQAVTEQVAPEIITADMDADAFEMDEVDFGDAASQEAVIPEVEVDIDSFSGLESSPVGSESVTDSAEDDTLFVQEDASVSEAEPALFEDSAETTTTDTVAEIAAETEPAPGEVAADSFQDDISDVADEAITAAPVLPADLPLVSYGVLLRRHADLTALVQAQHMLGKELGQDGSLSLDSLLVRASAKALETVDLVTGKHIGLARLEGGDIKVDSVADAHALSFRDLVQHLDEGSDAQDADLIVIDMSDMGVDEAVLNLDAPVLALGRILHDSEEGTHHSALTLSGDVPVEAGSKFLSAVADLLGSPIRLVL